MNTNPPIQDKVIALPGKRASTTGPAVERKPTLLPGAGRPNAMRSHLVAGLGEFVGTFLFLFFAFAGTQVANAASATSGQTGNPSASTLLYIALAFGFSLAVNAWVFFRISGGLFNPAVTFGLMLIGCLTYTRALIVFIAQILGAIASAAVVAGLFPGRLNVATTLSPETSTARGFFIEMFLTFELVFTIFLLAAEKHRATFLAPIGIGLSLFIAELAGVRFTGGSLNPARSFAPHVINGNFPSIHWIYWLGPFLGAILAVFFYRFIKALEYETYGASNQDADHIPAAVPVANETAGPIPRGIV